ncbi:hypothetical protein [Ginsengibacter hankyongi]|uniref:hypothetical protein n=1 Tax=Ginsengibacter hankyongi TaxID=2607284 RepID=UPI001928CE6E|nr:hypothetical protein [Ginsengibacter hankyongi]
MQSREKNSKIATGYNLFIENLIFVDQSINEHGKEPAGQHSVNFFNLFKGKVVE